MKVKFINKYISIEEFSEFELPDFSIITGLNGSGKSHFLKAIEQENIKIDDINPIKIKYFDYESFRVKNDIKAKDETLNNKKNELWKQFQFPLTKQIFQPIISFIKEKESIFRAMCIKTGKNIFDLTETDFNDNDLYFTFINYLSEINNIIKSGKSSNIFHIQPSIICAILDILKKSNLDIINITEYIFFKNCNLVLFSIKLDLSLSLSAIFYNYYKQKEDNIYNKFRNEQEGKSLPFYEKDEFEKIYGKPPWEELNNIIKNFDNFDYQFNYPTDEEQGYLCQLIDKKTNIAINFEDLSSGEVTLIALAIVTYQVDKNVAFPELVLLDEIDASLHPYMTKNLLEICEKHFIPKKIKVIMATHSPSTIAYAQAESIFVMKRTGENRIIKDSKENALHILSPGFFALTEEQTNLSIQLRIKNAKTDNILFTEGVTDSIILDLAYKKLHDGKNCPFTIEPYYDAGSLKSLFSRGTDSAHGAFTKNPDKKFIALFDFDSTGYQSWNSLFEDHYIKFIDDPMRGLTRYHRDFNAAWLLLPVPNNEEIKKQILDPDTGDHFVDKSKLEIEHLLYGFPETKKYFSLKNAPGGKIIELATRKIRLAKKCETLPEECFENFKTLFATIDKIFCNFNNR